MEKRKEKTNQKTFWDKFFATLLVIFTFFMGLLVVYDFLYATFYLSYQMYLVLALIAIVLLSRSFEHLEITNFLKLHKDVEWYKGEVNRLTGIINKINVSVVNHNAPASVVPTSSDSGSTKLGKFGGFEQNTSEIIKTMINRYMELKGYPKNKLFFNVILHEENTFEIFGMDTALFGGYFTTDNSEVFIDVFPQLTNDNASFHVNILLNHLTSLSNYRKSKNVNAKILALYIVKDKNTDFEKINAIRSLFEKPCMDNLLEFDGIVLNSAELSEINKLEASIPQLFK
ncbi:hypothetical protein HNP93_000987 [Methanococcus maripaludis]|uniref:Uncharacterized protein n=1 Tax=Methanococcus maripaludis TaxID=39152 RepID=A0A7J9P6H3_METMI|nr:hypothetical protein [Methanococcus maripaludis]MBA2858286.1 hypothetical protein [Methanococcus maripaludis]